MIVDRLTVSRGDFLGVGNQAHAAEIMMSIENENNKRERWAVSTHFFYFRVSIFFVVGWLGLAGRHYF